MSAVKDPLAGLNPQQIAAVTAPPGPVLVLAGAGSGKTRTLIHRLAYLIANGVSPSSILLLTFTNKAAREMIHRAAQILPEDVLRIWAGTFHSIGYRILRRRRVRLGEPPLAVLDRDDAEQLLKFSYAEVGVDPKNKNFPKPSVLGPLLSYSINTRTPLEEVVAQKYDEFFDDLELISKIAAVYEQKKNEANAADFDDLLAAPLALLTANPEDLEFYQRTLRFILVDEYQDTNALQSDLVDLLAGEAANITAVGDDAQCIYSWRGADYRNIINFQKRHPKALIYRIETNYRSLPGILEVANASIRNNCVQFPKILLPAREAPDIRPVRVALATSDAQAQFVVSQIVDCLESGVPPGEIAILYRAHYQSMEVQLALTRAGLRFEITSGIRFYEQAHIKDVAAWLRFATNPRDEVSFKRLLKPLPGVGEKTAEGLWNRVCEQIEKTSGNELPALGSLLDQIKPPKKAVAEWQQLCRTLDQIAPGSQGNRPSPSEAIQIIVEAGYGEYLKRTYPDAEDRLTDLEELARFGDGFDDLTEMLAQISLQTDPDERVGQRTSGGDLDRQITLSTVHQAKGLEWSVVFLIYLCEGMFPTNRAIGNPGAIEEERRLFYVATTRAKDKLYLLRPLVRQNAGWGDPCPPPSRFLVEIPDELTENWELARTPF